MLIISIIGSLAQYVLRQTLSRVLNVSELFIPGLPIQSSYSTIYLCLQSAHPAVHLHFFLLHVIAAWIALLLVVVHWYSHSHTQAQ